MRKYKRQVKICNARRYFLVTSLDFLFLLSNLTWLLKIESQLKPYLPGIPEAEHSNVHEKG